jgi:hypothetical protein
VKVTLARRAARNVPGRTRRPVSDTLRGVGWTMGSLGLEPPVGGAVTGSGNPAPSASADATSSSSCGSVEAVPAGSTAPASPIDPPAKTSAGQSVKPASAVFEPSSVTSAETTPAEVPSQSASNGPAATRRA